MRNDNKFNWRMFEIGLDQLENDIHEFAPPSDMTDAALLQVRALRLVAFQAITGGEAV